MTNDIKRLRWHPFEIAPPAPPAPPAPLSSAGGAASRIIALVGGCAATAATTALALERQGDVVHRFEALFPHEEREAAAFVRRVGRIDGIVDLNLSDRRASGAPVDLLADGESDVWEAPLRQTVALLKSVYADWSSETDAERLFYLAVTHLGGTMGYSGTSIPEPLGGIWAGLAKTLPREIPNCRVKVLDLSVAEMARIGERIAQETRDWGLCEIGYRDGKRYTLSAFQEDVGPPTVTLDAQDVIVMSGGARGIGLEIALTLARDYGCRIILSGRTAVPAATDPEIACDETEFKRRGQERLKSPPPGTTIAQLKREHEQLKRRRELFATMEEVRAEGLPIEYRVCDFSSPDAVHNLLTTIGPALTGVIHNAGLDTPIRLPAKSLETFAATIRIKVGGFLNIVRALHRNDSQRTALKFFCNVGSLTGRLGGMIGETDYSAANDGLARLGFWAARENGLPVHTVCWPTWERLGMIANFDVALKYMSALAVEEGVAHWRRELLAAQEGEITFLGRPGGALSPHQLRCFPATADIPRCAEFRERLAFLGRVLEYQQFRQIVTRNTITPGSCPALSDFRIDDVPALPISVLLEFALSVGYWITPEGWPDLVLHELRDITLYPSSLKADGAEGMVTFDKEGLGRWENDRWIVELTLTRRGGLADASRMLTLQMVYGSAPLSAPLSAQKTEVREVTETIPFSICPSPSGLNWKGWVIPFAAWRRDTSGLLHGEAPNCTPNDLWALPVPLPSSLPSGGLENIFRAVSMLAVPGAPECIRIARVTGGNAIMGCAEYVGTRECLSIVQKGAQTWLISRKDGSLVLCLEGLQFGDASHQKPTPVASLLGISDAPQNNSYAP